MKTVVPRLLLSTTLSLFICFCFAQPGTLDSSFGVNGKVTSNFATVGYYSHYCEPIALQADGKIVVASSRPFGTGQSDFIVERYKSNGIIDSTFGNNGSITTIFDTTISQSWWGGFVATCIIVQPDEKILAGGFGYEPFFGPKYFCLARYQSNGRLDSTFGHLGLKMDLIGPFPKENELYSLALQKDGKILAGGSSDGYCVVRYNSNGFIDSSFAVNGILRNQDIPSYGPTALSLENDGKIITGEQGQKNWENDTMFFQIDRLLVNGSYDSTFGINGHVFTDFSSRSNFLYFVLSLTDGSIFATGNSGASIAIAKYKNNGSLDSTFGTNGKLLTLLGESNVYAKKILAQPDGKLIIVGQSGTGNSLISRFFSNGTIDSTFGTNGKVLFNFGVGTVAQSMALQVDGKIIAIGNPGTSLARFKGDHPTTTSLQKNISITEGNSGTTPALFKVVLNKPAATDVFVNYTTKNLNAVAGSDYTFASGTVRIKAGKIKANIVVNVIGDNTREPNERFALVLSNPVNAVLGTIDSVTCTIKNDDPSFALSSSAKENIITASNIKIYPNPVKDVLTIEGLNAAKKSTISIINSTGLTLSKTTTTGNMYAWNIKQLPAGTYFVKIETGDNTETIKFVKQ